MKKLVLVCVLLCFAIVTVPLSVHVLAADNAARILDIEDGTYLLDDGSIWVDNRNGPLHVNLDVASIAVNGKYGVTRTGELVKWNYDDAPSIDSNQTGIRQISDEYYIKTDGTVGSVSSGPIKNMANVLQLGAANDKLAYVLQNGEVRYSGFQNSSLDKLDNPSSIVDIETNGKERTVTLDNTGKLMIYDMMHFDPKSSSLKVLPETAAANAAHISFAEGNRVIVTLKDGTVWSTGKFNDSFKLVEQIPNIKDAVQTSCVTSTTKFCFQQTDGSWMLYSDGEISKMAVPAVTDLKFELSDSALYVGKSISAKITEFYSNEAKKTILPAEAIVTIQNPHVLSRLSNGTFKALAVGETEITVSSGDISKTLTVSASLEKHLTGAKQVKGTLYLPVESLFKTLGGTAVYSASTKSYNITLGSQTITLATGDAKAKVDETTITMSGAVLAQDKDVLFPASLLTKALGAVLKWDAQYKQLTINLGKATMTVDSAETAKIIKKVAQGSLTDYIGKAYWINSFQGWERFSKVTITDIAPDGNNFFTIHFTTANGKKLKS
jgi:phage baseplate assembly protein gpV